MTIRVETGTRAMLGVGAVKNALVVEEVVEEVVEVVVEEVVEEVVEVVAEEVVEVKQTYKFIRYRNK